MAINSVNIKNTSSGRSRDSLIFGDVKITCPAWNNVKKRPISFSYQEKLKDFLGQFDFSLPNTTDYIIPKKPYYYCEVFLNDTYYCSGRLIKAKKNLKENIIDYQFICEGYQIAKTHIVDWFKPITTNNAEGYNPTISAFIDNLIKSNLKLEDDYVLNYNEENIKILKTDKGEKIKTIFIYPENKIYFKTIKYLIYDPFNIGKQQITKLIDFNNFKLEGNPLLFEAISEILKSANIFMKCLGRYDKISNLLEKQYIYGTPSNNINTTNYVILLWRPNYNDINNPYLNSKTFKKIAPDTFTNTIKTTTTTMIGNQVSKIEVETQKVPKEFKNIAKAGFGILKPKMQTTFEEAKRFTNLLYQKPIYQPVEDITLLTMNDFVESPEENWDFENRYDTIVFKRGEKANEENDKSPYLYVKDFDTNDGTVMFYDKEIHFKNEALNIFAYYEQARRIANSYSINFKVKGFTQSPADYHTQITYFWGINQLINYNGSLYLIEEIKFNFGENGVYTELKAILPGSYTTVLPKYTIENDVIEEEGLKEFKEKSKKQFEEIRRKEGFI